MIYIALAPGTDTVKIGWSEDPKTRVKNLSFSSPVVLKTLVVLPGGRLRESLLHDQFAEERLHGEWFRYSDRLREFVASKEAQWQST